MAGLLAGLAGVVSAGIGGGAGAYKEVLDKDKEAERIRLRDEALSAKQEALVRLSDTLGSKRDETKHGWDVVAAQTAAQVNKEAAAEAARVSSAEITQRGNEQIRVAKAAASIAASAEGQKNAASIKQIKDLKLAPADEERAIVAVVTKMDLANPKNALSPQYGNVYRATLSAIDNDPANEKMTAAEKVKLADRMTKVQIGQSLAGEEQSTAPATLDIKYIEAGKAVGKIPPTTTPTAPIVNTAPEVPTVTPTPTPVPTAAPKGILSPIGRGAVGGIRELFSDTSASQLGKNATENVKRWTGIK